MKIPQVAGLLLASAIWGGAAPQARILDLTHYSNVFGEERHFRIFLPPDYDANPEKRYPVVYFFHGWSERYNGSPVRGYDSGSDYDGDNFASFVGTHDLILVKWDGYNPRTPGEKYLRPYNISPVETYRQFPLYFPELVRYIDEHFRTIADREHRGTSGLSMGGFMSFWVAGKYPDLVGSASNFMGSSEFYAGPNGFPTEYRHTEMYGNYDGLRTRLVMGKKDFIQFYHRRMNAVWDFARPDFEHEEFDWDHGTPGIAKTLAFHMNAFRDPLPKPVSWRHADVYPAFDVWGWSVETDRRRPGFTMLENVNSAGLRSSVREWLPDGPVMPYVRVNLATPPVYKPGTLYRVVDVNLETGAAAQQLEKADETGRLRLSFDGGRHEIGISATPHPILALSNWQVEGASWAAAGREVRLKVELLNKGTAAARSVRATFRSLNPGVSFQHAIATSGPLGAGSRTIPTEEIVFSVADPAREVVAFQVRLESGVGQPPQAEIPVVVPLYRDAPTIKDFVVADGSKLAVWQRAVDRAERVLGAGNGDGVANPGETIAVAVRDGDAWRPAELFTNDSCVSSITRLSDSWGGYDHVGATAKITLPVIASNCPEGHEIPFFVRYQVPDKPNHILKEGVVQVRVTGRDQTAPQVRWAQAGGWNRLRAEIRDGAEVKSATATLKNGDAVLKVPLRREGSLFVGLLPNPAPGKWALTIAAEDTLGNAGESSVPANLEFFLPPPEPRD